MTSYADHLRPFFPWFPPALVDDRWLTEIAAVTAHLPAGLASGPFLLECGLGDERAADLSVGVVAPGPLAQVRAADDAWAGIRQLARLWSDPASALGTVRQVWLEFDVGLTAPRVPGTPSVFFDVAGGADPAAVAACGLEALGTTAPAAVLDRIREHPGVLFVGAMLARRTDAVRVVGPAPEVVPALDPVLVEELRSLAAEVWLAVDVGPSGPGRRVGLDVHVARGAERAVLDLLVGSGLCTTGTRDAVLATVRMDEPESARAGEDLGRLATLLGPDGLDVLRMSLNHVKVVGGAGLPTSAKAYLRGNGGRRDGAA